MMNMLNSIRSQINSSVELKSQVLNDPILVKKIEDSVNLIRETFNNKHKIVFCGNGGSAADAQHLAAEFSGRYYYDRPPLYAEALHVNSSYITAVSNDYSFDIIYARMLEAMCVEGDVLIAMSTSGNSENIVKAALKAKEKNMKVISFTGSTGGKLAPIADVLLNVPSNDTPRIQECHMLIGHIICKEVEALIFPNK